jgi:hypothetical protein
MKNVSTLRLQLASTGEYFDNTKRLDFVNPGCPSSHLGST